MEVQAQTVKVKPGETSMTYEEFLAWADEDTLAEWVDGRVIVYSPASLLHQDVAGWLYRLISDYAEWLQLGKVFSAPTQMKLARSGREPDVMFVAHEHMDRLQGLYVNGPADLVIEVVSSSTAGADRGEKYYEYEEARVGEYWLIDPRPKRQYAEFYRPDDRGRYRPVAIEEGIFRSEVLRGFWLRVDWLWQVPLPHPITVLAEIRGLPAWWGSALTQAIQSGEVPPQMEPPAERDPSQG